MCIYLFHLEGNKNLLTEGRKGQGVGVGRGFYLSLYVFLYRLNFLSTVFLYINKRITSNRTHSLQV